MNARVGCAHAIQLRQFVRRPGQNARRVQTAPRGNQGHAFHVGGEDADVTLGEPRRGAPPLLLLFLTGGGPRLNQNIADAQLFNEPQRFFSCAPAPIASMPITAPTPKMIPSAVRNVRVF